MQFLLTSNAAFPELQQCLWQRLYDFPPPIISENCTLEMIIFFYFFNGIILSVFGNMLQYMHES